MGNSMNSFQKKSDGIRRSGVPEPIRLSAKRPAEDESLSAREREAELREEKTEEKHGAPLRETRGAPEKIDDEMPILHIPSPGRRPSLPAGRASLPARAARWWTFGRGALGALRSAQRPAQETHASVIRVNRSWGRMGAYAGVIAVAIIFILLSTVFARLTVTVKPRVEEAAIERVGALFDTSVSKVLVSQKVIPAEALHFSKSLSREFPATGSGRVDERARGTALVFNAFNTQPQLLVAGTRFTTDTGAVYRIQKALTVPGAAIEKGKIVPRSVAAELVADAGGGTGNAAGPMSLKIPGFAGSPRYQGFYAVAKQGFAGGFTGEGSIVTKDDLARAEEDLSKALFSELDAQMLRGIPAGLFLLKELREIQIVKMEAPKAGSRAEHTFSVSAEAKGEALVFREQDIVDLLASFALEGIKNQEFIPGSARLSYAVRNVDFEKGRAEVTVGGNLKIKEKIPERELASLIAGKKEGSAIEALKARRELARFTLSLFPPWRATAPGDPAKIRFRVETP